ncbi:hypothetical protein [Rathayibacter sp. VKM Ac-2927]|uniref:hypothetical protein n=1 Tax=Rathayibacter sp. VKM Ac-2927 TaxID=2929478 RepID=UPI001FB454BE|nr:hypothetical protein [Rathayibacter sp. VKM Ac-2927]
MMRLQLTKWTSLTAMAGLIGAALLAATPNSASAIQYSGRYFTTSSACRAEVKAYRTEGWKILKNCPFVDGYGYLIDASKG